MHARLVFSQIVSASGYTICHNFHFSLSGDQLRNNDPAHDHAIKKNRPAATLFNRIVGLQKPAKQSPFSRTMGVL